MEQRKRGTHTADKGDAKSQGWLWNVLSHGYAWWTDGI